MTQPRKYGSRWSGKLYPEVDRDHHQPEPHSYQTSYKRKIFQGSASNMARLVLSMVVAITLPPLLVHRMMPAEYSAWVLILQISAYVNLLELGLQTAIGKFVAEHDAIGNRAASSRILSSSFALLCVSATCGAAALGVVAWQVPRLFHQMPATLIGEAREAILIIGLSTVVALPFSAFLAVFTGLQRYGFPTALAMASKILVTASLIAVLLLHGELVQLAWVMAVFNLGTATSQYLGWRKWAKERVDFSWKLIDRETASRLVKYGSVLSIWSLALLLISGLDTVIVGHYDYRDTGYYGVAASAATFMVLVITNLFAPLLPAVSSLQAGRTPRQLGDMVIKATRYCGLLICLSGLPLLFGAYPLLRLWVGYDYAVRSALFLQVLVVGNAIRQFGYPYALIIVATGKQHLATVAGVTEAVVNITVSVYLVQRVGAVGVALGTLVGAFVSLGTHLLLSMKLTQSTALLSRRHLVRDGFVRPLLCVIPSVFFFLMRRGHGMTVFSTVWTLPWAVSTLGIAWFAVLTFSERLDLEKLIAGAWARRPHAVKS